MQIPALKNKSKRVQKKLYLNDYAMLGFEVSAKFTQDDETEINSFFDKFIELIETKNLCFGGGYTINDFDGFITSAERYNSPSEDDRLAVQELLASQANLSDVVVGSFIDANYGN